MSRSLRDAVAAFVSMSQPYFAVSVRHHSKGGLDASTVRGRRHRACASGVSNHTVRSLKIEPRSDFGFASLRDFSVPAPVFPGSLATVVTMRLSPYVRLALLDITNALAALRHSRAASTVPALSLPKSDTERSAQYASKARHTTILQADFCLVVVRAFRLGPEHSRAWTPLCGGAWVDTRVSVCTNYSCIATRRTCATLQRVAGTTILVPCETRIRKRCWFVPLVWFMCLIAFALTCTRRTKAA